MHGLLHNRSVQVGRSGFFHSLLCFFRRLPESTDSPGGQSNERSDVLRGLPGLHLPAPLLRIVVLLVQNAQPRKKRYRTSAHSTRMMVGRYIFRRIEFTDSLSVSVTLESCE